MTETVLPSWSREYETSEAMMMMSRVVEESAMRMALASQGRVSRIVWMLLIGMDVWWVLSV
jgi:hypothetical protein